MKLADCLRLAGGGLLMISFFLPLGYFVAGMSSRLHFGVEPTIIIAWFAPFLLSIVAFLLEIAWARIILSLLTLPGSLVVLFVLDFSAHFKSSPRIGYYVAIAGLLCLAAGFLVEVVPLIWKKINEE